ncbi:HAMP domain-containing sensor histidine kinase [Inconstantimicrobium mannanitabidum]|uniref:Two-component sensor histidine kinase n=1 Tax=Inconstantimicrobium mannanitabidum TaxID=1604901 RepID=A0ACB5R865_9CLOT|nr:HAMP domain-containing sensor histidine kinase [Clostridium sp. TW13]GKX65384.1 two-component sensor histidine kinase [Clostridium sp. TW13]
MKRDKISIKWNIFAYLSIFTGVMIVFLWFFQTVFLDDFYKTIKSSKIKSCAETVAENIDSSDLSNIMLSLSRQNDISIKITDKNGVSLDSIGVGPNSIIDRLSNEEIGAYYSKAEKNGGTSLQTFSEESFKINFKKPMDDMNFQDNNRPPDNRKKMESMLYVDIVSKKDGAKVMILVHSTITPLDATVETLRTQLIFITVIFMMLSIALAVFISKKISNPIVKINDSAKELAKGKYDTKFEGTGYKEITELNSTLNYAANELSKVDGLRKELIANISHDLRTPLTLITGYSEVMRDLPGENSPENIQIIIDEAKRLTSLVNDILDISKFESGTQEIELSEFNLTESIRNMINRYGKFTEQKGYNISFIYDEDTYIKADEMKISQVVYNLINNALTYTGKDKSVTVKQYYKDGYVRIEVIDTGEGISQEKIPLIWDRYYKVDKAHKRAAVGTGLGLSIVKSILDMHDGRYGVESTEGKGSTFWFELKTL